MVGAAFGGINPKQSWEISGIKTILTICINQKAAWTCLKCLRGFSMRCILVVEYLALFVEELLSVLDVDLSLQQVLGLAAAEVVDGA